MELDKRITDISKIMNCFTTEHAKEYIYTSGYFADHLEDFVDLDCIDRCELVLIQSEFKYPYCVDGDSFKFFLPCAFVKEETEQKQEKKYRPYTLDEFLDVFPIGQPIKFRNKEYKFKKVLIFNGYETLSSGNAVIDMGTTVYTPQELFDVFELQKPNEEEWQPFGVEE